MRQPLRILAGITPFNFPAMIPIWRFGVAIACGNAFILKPSERDPSVPVRLAELMQEAGLPDGILQVVHGDKEMVDAILDEPDIKAVSFVGSSDIAQYIYSRKTANGNRVRAFGGARTSASSCPTPISTWSSTTLPAPPSARRVSAAWRCRWWCRSATRPTDALRELVPAIEGLRVGVSTDPDGHYGPVVHAAHKARIEDYYPDVRRRGGRAGRRRPRLHAADGADARFRGRAARLPSERQYGNSVAIFTRNGHAAREFAARVNVGMVGINVPIPVPVAYHMFGGWKRSGFGDIDQHGPEGVRFWTKVKKVTQRWPNDSATGENAFVIRTTG